MGNDESTIARYVTASEDEDFATLASLRHEEWEMVWPQSGERVVGHDNYVAMRVNRPEGAPRVEALETGGSGDTWWGESIIHYADGSRWLGVWLFELRDGLVHRERVYFGQPFPAPAWRAKWVTHGEPAIR
ncbi:MAG: nuclear transport factor 2 family protein [Chloroflexota bacterium]|nr:nuclear transport factor 2 family protein [Chloroflexota bacterium]